MNRQAIPQAKQRLRDILRRKAWTLADLADAARLERRYVKFLVDGSLFATAGWRQIERVLGAPLWHSPAQFALHERALRCLSLDAIFEPIALVRAKARELGIIQNATTRKPGLAAILSAIAALTEQQVGHFERLAGPNKYWRPQSAAELLARMTPAERAGHERLVNPPERRATEKKKRKP